MSTLANCLNYLDGSGIRYAHTTHVPAFTAEEVAEAENMPPHRLAKTVVCESDESYVMVVVPADSYVDMEQTRAALGAEHLQLASEDELIRLFPDAEVGAMPALGNLFGFPVYLERELDRQEFIAFNAGTHRDLIHMKVADFRHIVRPVTGDFSRRKYYPAAGFIAVGIV